MLSAEKILQIKIEEYSSRIIKLTKDLDNARQNALIECILNQALAENDTQEIFDASQTKISIETKETINFLARDLKTAKTIYDSLLAFQSKNKPEDLNRLEKQWVEEINRIAVW